MSDDPTAFPPTATAAGTLDKDLATLTPQQRHALLRRLSVVLGKMLDISERAVVDEYEATGGDRWRTAAGTVTVTGTEPSIVIDDDKLLAWVQQHRPGEIEQRVRSSYRDAIRRGLRIGPDGSSVYHRDTGEVVDYAFVGPSRPSARVREDDAVRDAAVPVVTAMVAAHLDELLATAPASSTGQG